MEGFLILLGILWLLGIFRGFVIPITVKHEVNVKNNSGSDSLKSQTSNLKSTSANPPRYGLNDAEDIDYEEVK
ncbi:MAG: hypothetical protein ACOZCO_18210 [Bacteroidota bacterium]